MNRNSFNFRIKYKKKIIKSEKKTFKLTKKIN